MTRGAMAIAIMVVPSLWRPLPAQRLSGTTIRSIDSVALRGVVVSLVDARGTALHRTVSGANGRFILPVTDDVRAVQVRRIGYKPRDFAIPDSAHRTTAVVDIRLDPLPAVLDPVVVSDSATAFRLSSEQARALWEQARMAYLATEVTQRALGDSVRVLLFQHTYSPKGPPLTKVRSVRSDSGRMFAASRSPESFAMDGFGLYTGGNSVAIQAPDFGVLMHESFAATHRFFMAPENAFAARMPRRAGQVGIAFEPNPGRSHLVDISGILWMDRSPLALRSVEFRFVAESVPVARFVAAASVGEINFDMAENGAVIIRDWRLQIPAGMETRGTGGVLAFAKWTDGARFERHFPHVTGTVVAKTGAPYSGAQVAISDTPFRGVAARDGSFDVPDVFPGFYNVIPFDSTLSAFGIASTGPGVRLVAEGDRNGRVALKLDPPYDAARSACREKTKTFDAGDGVLGIRLVDSAGAVVQRKIPLSLRLDVNGRERRVIGETSGAGFVACGTRPGRVTIEATGADWVGTTSRELTAPGKVVDTVTLVVHVKG